MVGSERNAFVAVLRRLRDVTPLPYQLDWVGEALQIPYHFDFTRSGQSVMSVDRRWGMRDRYVVDIQDPYLDRRLAIALAVALDALQGR